VARACTTGVPAPAMEAIRACAPPNFADKDQTRVYRIITELIDTKRLPNASFAEAISAMRRTRRCRVARDHRLLHGD